MRGRFVVVLLLGCASCQLFLSFGDSDDAATDAGPGQVLDGAAPDARVDAGADVALGSDVAATDASPIDASNGTCILPPGTVGICPQAGTATSCDGGVLWQGHCYFALSPSSVMFNYSTARQACNGVGAALATFTCEDEWTHARAILAGSGIYYVVDGLIGTKCAWADDEPWVYAPWNGAPASGDDCVKVNAGGWYSFPCGADNAPHALCERQ